VVGLVRQLIFQSHDSAFHMDSVSLISGQLHSGLAPMTFDKLSVTSHSSCLSTLLVSQAVQGHQVACHGHKGGIFLLRSQAFQSVNSGFPGRTVVVQGWKVLHWSGA
jgi:hypothetical protein